MGVSLRRVKKTTAECFGLGDERGGFQKKMGRAGGSGVSISHALLRRFFLSPMSLPRLLLLPLLSLLLLLKGTLTRAEKRRDTKVLNSEGISTQKVIKLSLS